MSVFGYLCSVFNGVLVTNPLSVLLQVMKTLAEAVTAGYVPLFEDLGGGKAQLVHLSYQELFVGEFMARALTSAFGGDKLFESVAHSLVGADLARLENSWWFAPVRHCWLLTIQVSRYRKQGNFGC